MSPRPGLRRVHSPPRGQVMKELVGMVLEGAHCMNACSRLVVRKQEKKVRREQEKKAVRSRCKGRDPAEPPAWPRH